MSTAQRWLLRLTLAALAVLLTADRRRPTAPPLPKPAP